MRDCISIQYFTIDGGKEIVLATVAETHRDAKNSQKSFEKKNELKALFYPTMRRRKSSRREKPNLLHYLCNWKSICRLTAIFESLLLGSLLIGSITIIWIFNIRDNTDNDVDQGMCIKIGSRIARKFLKFLLFHLANEKKSVAVLPYFYTYILI